MTDSIQSQDSTVDPPPLDVLDEALKRCEQERQEYLQGWQRARADYDNLARRMFHECDEAREQGVTKILHALAPVFDNFGRAAAKLPPELEHNDWVKGFEHIAREWEETLTKLGIQKIKTVGELFDPTRHEALTQSQDTDKPENVVIEEVEAGYEYKGKIIKAAKVIINNH